MLGGYPRLKLVSNDFFIDALPDYGIRAIRICFTKVNLDIEASSVEVVLSIQAILIAAPVTIFSVISLLEVS